MFRNVCRCYLHHRLQSGHNSMCFWVVFLYCDVQMNKQGSCTKMNMSARYNTKWKMQTEQVWSTDTEEWIKLKCDSKIRRPSSLGKGKQLGRRCKTCSASNTLSWLDLQPYSMFTLCKMFQLVFFILKDSVLYIMLALSSLLEGDIELLLFMTKCSDKRTYKWIPLVYVLICTL